MNSSVLLDTSFFIRLLNYKDPLHDNAKGYFQYFINKQITLKISTISIAEYCVQGKVGELPLRNIQIVPFNLNHAEKTGEFAGVIFERNKVSEEKLYPRVIIPNDSKLFAQAELDKSITHFVTSDKRSKKTYSLLETRINPNFKVVDIAKKHMEEFGILL